MDSSQFIFLLSNGDNLMRLLWMQAGACGGGTQSLLCADNPPLEQLIEEGLELLWQPSLSAAPTHHLERLIAAITSGQIPLDILCVEGSLITGPKNTRLWDPLQDRGKKDTVLELAEVATYVLAVGTCAAYGGIHAAPPNPTDCLGMQFDQASPGGLLPTAWRSKSGFPVINLTGCPTHPNTVTKFLAFLLRGLPVTLDKLQRPTAFFSTTVHQGCSRNEYHEYDVEDTALGDRGCLFFNLGCQGPLTLVTCNQELWNGRSSKTRAGVPCFGCTSPQFPQDSNLFATEKIGHIPLRLPIGVQRANYMAYKDLAHEATPERLIRREMEP